MHRYALLALLLVAACDDTGPIAVRSGQPDIGGNAFTCTGSWPSDQNPCHMPWDSNPLATSRQVSGNELELSLLRGPIPVDGGASTVDIYLELDGNGAVVGARARESTTHPGDARTDEESAATGGWIEPVIVSLDRGRNAGLFEVDFDWGSISGRYDSAPAP